MKEVLTKNFWKGVKKTFYDALEDPPAEKNESQAPVESVPKDSATPETPSSQSATS